jgi:sulfur-oxidizing protein SoxY
MRQFFFALLMAGLFSVALAEEMPEDPLGSIQWDDMYRAYLSDHKVIFDDRVKVIAPEFAEDSMNVPVSVDASELTGVKEILLFAEFNPIPKILKFYPESSQAAFSFRFKIQQASPVRAAVLTDDNVWHVGGVWIDAAGGGCTTASDGRLAGDWADHLGEIHAAIWDKGSTDRTKISINHPMDTGLVAGIPSFYIEIIELTGEDGKLLAKIEPYEPIQENPVFTLNLFKSEVINIEAIDNNANEFSARIVR